MMRMLISSLLLASLLAACSPQIIGPTATPTETPTPAPSATPPQTPIPEATATPTETPTPKVPPTETFAPMELSTDPEHPAKCTYEDVTSGRLAWNVIENTKPFPDDSINKGWVNPGGPDGKLGTAPGSKDIFQLVSICTIEDSFLGFTDGRISYVASLAVKNTDGTTGVINIFLPKKDYLDGFMRLFPSFNSNGMGLFRQLNEDQEKKNWNGAYGQMFRLYPTEGREKVKTTLNKLQITGIADETGRILFIYGKPGA